MAWPDITEGEIAAATDDAFTRGSRALEEAALRPCAFCGAKPRANGDHYCARCRHNVNETRRLAGIDIKKEASR